MKKAPKSNGMEELRARLIGLSLEWIENGLPARSIIEQTANEISDWKTVTGINGIWLHPPHMLTASLDDGSGLGLNIIEQYASIAGMRVRRLGLCVHPEVILDACRRDLPDFLGLTVLQTDSEEALAQIGHGLPPQTCMVAGGPAFRSDPDLGDSGRVDFVARNVAFFIDFLLKWMPPESH